MSYDARQQPPYQPYGRQPRRARRPVRRKILVTLACGIAAIVIGSAAGHHRTAAGAAASGQTVTFTVTGTAVAQVTYGPAGTQISGSVPMNVTAPLGDPAYYSLSAQLQGGGEVSCSIAVDGTVISSGTADGGYNIAVCEISQDPFSGQWQSDQG
jgi:hypothetical protein